MKISIVFTILIATVFAFPAAADSASLKIIPATKQSIPQDGTTKVDFCSSASFRLICSLSPFCSCSAPPKATETQTIDEKDATTKPKADPAGEETQAPTKDTPAKEAPTKPKADPAGKETQPAKPTKGDNGKQTPAEMPECGNIGKANAFVGCPVINECCSEFGFCGTSKEFCNAKQQTKGDPANKKFQTQPAKPTKGDNGKQTPAEKPECGNIGKANAFVGCPVINECCSEFGFCGTSKEFCNAKQQTKGDPANKKSPENKDQPTKNGPAQKGGEEPECGNIGKRNAFVGCPVKGECCSEFGFCGISKEFCNAKQQTEGNKKAEPATKDLPAKIDSAGKVAGAKGN